MLKGKERRFRKEPSFFRKKMIGFQKYKMCKYENCVKGIADTLKTEYTFLWKRRRPNYENLDKAQNDKNLDDWRAFDVFDSTSCFCFGK